MGYCRVEYKAMDDQTLVELTLLGNSDAYSELVERHQKAVLNTALAVTRNHYTAEDAAQDAFVTAWTKLDTLKDRSSFKAWVCAIARNRARRLAERYREYVPLEEVENLIEEPDGAVEDGLELELLRDAVNRLSDKIRRVVTLFYFEGLSLAEIADRESVSVAAVKSRLHDGRMKLRKDMGYMANEYETLPEAVERRLTEIKKWQFKTEKRGFSADYDSLLADIRALPESQVKYHAMADLMLHGFWWLEGERQNEQLLKELEDAAYKGDNKDVIRFLIEREQYKLPFEDRAEFILKTQIPKFESLGMKEAVGEEWGELSFIYQQTERYSEAHAALEKAIELLPPENKWRASAQSALKMHDKLGGFINHADRYWYAAQGITIFRDGGRLLRSVLSYGGGKLTHDGIRSVFTPGVVDSILLCGDLKPGETYHGSHPGDTITLTGSDATVTACGRTYDRCYEYRIKSVRYNRLYNIWFKRGIGPVAFEERSIYGKPGKVGFDTRLELEAHTIQGGGNEFMPLAAGNKWRYAQITEAPLYGVEHICEYEVTHCTDTGATVAVTLASIQHEYGAALRDVMTEFCDRLCSGRVSLLRELMGATAEEANAEIDSFIGRIDSAAVTDYEREAAKQLTAFIGELRECDEALAPESADRIGWARFGLMRVYESEGSAGAVDEYSVRRWKPKDWTYSAWLADIFGILQDRMGVLWSRGWTGDVRFDKEFPNNWMNGIDLRVTGAFHYAGAVTVKAGTFDNCMVLSTQVLGGIRNAGYRLHDADYYFADGVGIIKVITHCGGFLGDVVYELASYSGSGKGFLPVDAGLKLRYECVNSHVGYESAMTYTFIDDDNGSRMIIYSGVGRHNKAVAEREERGNK